MPVKIAYITDLPLQPSGGGSYAVNWHAFHQLKARANVTPVVVTPKLPFAEQRWSQLLRKVLRQPGDFAYFSPGTLEDNARRVAAKLPDDSDALVFRSAARWCRCRPEKPYFVYLDIVFHTFFHNTFQPEEFRQSDLERIWREEAAFLENADGVFFESEWGLEQAKSIYPLKGDHYETLGRGGVISPPKYDRWDGQSLNLVTIAMNFEQKGGDVLMKAFPELRKRHPELRWQIIGGEPKNGSWRQFPEITYAGKLRPEAPTELARFEEMLASAFLIIHPTREDTNPLVITEAGYFGCPAISVRRFGIPELVRDGETGLLLDSPVAPTDLAAAITRLIEQPETYRSMRRKAREFALTNYSWDSLGDRLFKRISQNLEP